MYYVFLFITKYVYFNRLIVGPLWPIRRQLTALSSSPYVMLSIRITRLESLHSVRFGHLNRTRMMVIHAKIMKIYLDLLKSFTEYSWPLFFRTRCHQLIKFISLINQKIHTVRGRERISLPAMHGTGYWNSVVCI